MVASAKHVVVVPMVPFSEKPATELKQRLAKVNRLILGLNPGKP